MSLTTYSASSTKISRPYLALQQQLHLNPKYGEASIGYAAFVRKICESAGLRSISDYGAGKQNLRKALTNLGFHEFKYFPYDPAFPEYGVPTPAELVCCIDVLEHIEPEFLDNVLVDLAEITTNVGLFTVTSTAAKKILADGRNAHLIQEPASWWLSRLCSYFEIRTLRTVRMGIRERFRVKGFWVIVTPKHRIPHFCSTQKISSIPGLQSQWPDLRVGSSCSGGPS